MPKTQIRTNDSLSFKRCRRGWFLTSPHRMNLENRRPVDVFFIGRAIHYALAQMYEHGAFPVPTFKVWWSAEMKMVVKQTGVMLIEEEQIFEDLFDLGVGMLDGFAKWASLPENKMQGWEHVKSELEYELPLRTLTGRASPRYCMAGRIDRVVRIGKEIWGVEYKTINPKGFGSTGDGRLDKDEQATAYIYALSQVYPGEKIGGMKYVYLRKKLPSMPRVLKSGKLSKDKSQDTTLALMIQAIKENSLELGEPELYKEYQDILMHLRGKDNNFFKIEETKRHPKMLENYARDVYRISRDMVRVKTVMDAYPSPPWYGCKNCHVSDLCGLIDIGLNYNFLVNAKYRQRRPWDAVAESEETTV